MQAKPKNKLQKLLNKRDKVNNGKWSMTTEDYLKLCHAISVERRKTAPNIVKIRILRCD